MKIKKPLNLSLMAVKGKSDATRQMKRHATINVGERSVRILDHFQEMSKKLPKIVNKDTGKEFDHYYHLKKIYMEAGIDGVNEYLTTCSNVVNRDTGKWWIVRQLAKMRLRKYRKV